VIMDSGLALSARPGMTADESYVSGTSSSIAERRGRYAPARPAPHTFDQCLCRRARASENLWLFARRAGLIASA
jgi:hypothetical protein